MLQILAHARRPAKMTSTPPDKKKRDRASKSAQEYFEAVTELSELGAKRKTSWPDGLDDEDRRRWVDALRRKRIAKLDLSYWNPQTDAGAFAALKVVRHELQRIEAVLVECNAEDLLKILDKAEKALRRSARER